MTSDVLHLQPLEFDPNVVLSDVVRRGVLRNVVEHVLRQPGRIVYGHVLVVVRVGAGFAARDGHTPTTV